MAESALSHFLTTAKKREFGGLFNLRAAKCFFLLNGGMSKVITVGGIDFSLRMLWV